MAMTTRTSRMVIAAVVVGIVAGIVLSRRHGST